MDKNEEVHKNNKLTKDKNNNNILKDFLGINSNEEKLYQYFKNKRIYIEIFNVDINSSNDYYNLLAKYNIIAYRKLNKNIDYIVFKDGHLKTKKYAILNNIKLVNPFWIYDKIYNNLFKNDKEYIIKTNMTEICLSEKLNNYTKIKKYSSKKNDINNAFEIEDIRQNNINDDSNNTIENLFNIKREKRIINPIKKNELQDDKNKNIINKNTNLKKDTKTFANKSKNKKRGKSTKALKQQTVISINNDNLSFKYVNKYSHDIINKNVESNIDLNNKIQIISYKLEKKEFEVLQNLCLFDYLGNILNINDKILDSKVEYIILDYKKMVNNWELYKFLVEKKYVIDFTTFLLEFINEDDFKINNFNNKQIINIINAISLNNQLSILNKKKKAIQNVFYNTFLNNIYFIISKFLDNNEYEIIYKLLKNYLNANIIEEKNNNRRSKSFNKNHIKDDNQKNLNYLNTNDKITNNIYLIAKESTLNKYFDINNTYKGIIYHEYVYDSFIKGQLLDITNDDIFKKYKI